jgi:hypothetical protein
LRSDQVERAVAEQDAKKFAREEQDKLDRDNGQQARRRREAGLQLE